jgi:hypothetical protein
MTREALLLLLALATPLAAGCPIPQTVPEYPKGTSVTPPRIVAESASPQAALIKIPAACVTPPEVILTANIVYGAVDEPLYARWFVNYDPSDLLRRDPVNSPVEIPKVAQLDPNAPDTTRFVEAWPFSPYSFGSAIGTVHVVELVVSNGFHAYPESAPIMPLPNRTPIDGFETQVYRWVFLLVDAPGSCPP